MAEARARRSARSGTGPRTEEPAKSAPVCPVALCPVGMALTALRGASPEAVEHVLAAARELLLAARAVLDARAADAGRGGRPLERIEIA
ncbi:MAG TPA: hypothetical protein VNO79_05000 [Actinomycetota bacterium]|nr:hypothetical protein [Actinomycetota bacterium]